MKKLISEKGLFVVFLCLLATVLFVLPILNIFPNINSLISEVYATLIQTAFFGFSIFVSGYITSVLLIPKANTSERLLLSTGLSLGFTLITILFVSLFQSILQIPPQINYYSVLAIFIALCLAVMPKNAE